MGWGRDAHRPWDINGEQTPRTEDPYYDNLYKKFNPVQFDADQWVKIAQDSGMKYMVIICKHHDGFSMFDSKLTEYDIMATPYGKDIIKRFSAACHKAGMKLGLYYSTRDWYHPDYLVGGQWAYQPNGGMYTLEQTLGILVSCVTGGGNLLLNIGPMPTGEIEGRQVDLLKQLGDWIKPRAEAVYGTRGGPFPNGWWGGSTHHGNMIYVFARDWQGDTLRLQALPDKIKSVRKLAGGETVAFKQTDKGLDLTLPVARRDPLYTVFALTLDAPVADGTVLAGTALRSMFEDSVRYHTWIACPSAARVASWMASDIVGWAWMVAWISSLVSSWSRARPISAMSSVAFSPMRWAPNNSPCFLPNNNLANPSGSPEAMALPLAANGILPTLYSMPASLSARSVLPTDATCGWQYVQPGKFTTLRGWWPET